MRTTVEGTVIAISTGKTPPKPDGKGNRDYHDVTLLQTPPVGETLGQPELVKVRCWNGQVKELAVGKAGKIVNVQVRLLAGKDAQGRPYPPRLTADAF